MNITNYRTISFFDVETTSLDPETGEIIQICIVTEDQEGNLDEWSTKIRPRLKEGTYSKESLKINNFVPKDFIDAPKFEDIAEEIANRLKWGPIVAHNALFDVKFIESCLQRYAGWKPGSYTNTRYKTYRLGYPVIDTASLAYLILPTEKQNMTAMREYLEISEEGSHEAVKDVMDCRAVFWKCMESLMNARDITAG